MIRRPSRMMTKCACLYMEQWLGEKGYDVYQLSSDPFYAHESVLREWLVEGGFDPNEVFNDPTHTPR